MRLTESIITIWSAITCGASLLAILLAIRGRRIDDHPICRKCGFDLFGLPATSHNCPECGRDLTRKRTARIGHRRRLKSLLLVGLTLFLASAGWLGFLGVLVVRHEDWNRYKPVSWLLRDARSSVMRDEAITELIYRVGKNELSDNHMTEIADIALAHQSNRNEPWSPKWGQFVEAAHGANRLSAQQWQRYIQQALDCFELEVRRIVRRDHPIPFRITRLPRRGGPASLSSMRSLAPLFHLDGQVLPSSAPLGSMDGSMDSLKGPHEGLAELPVARVMQLEDGEHQAGVTINFKPSSTRFLKIANDPPYPYQVRVMRRIELLSGEVSTVSVHRKPEIDAQVERAISVNVSVDQVRKRLIVSVNNAGAPIDLAFQGQLSAGKLQRDLGFILFPANRPGNVTIPLNDVLQVWDPQQVDIELMPSLDAAEHTLDIFDIWGGHVSRVGVPVK